MSPIQDKLYPTVDVHCFSPSLAGKLKFREETREEMREEKRVALFLCMVIFLNCEEVSENDGYGLFGRRNILNGTQCYNRPKTEKL